MKIIDAAQGSPEWHAARVGIPTASRFDRIVTAGGKPSAQATKYLYEKLAEWLLGEPVEGWAGNEWMQRGTLMEPEAIRWYEFDRDAKVARPGFVVRDDGWVGCSPDGLVGDDGALEVKCESLVMYVGRLLGSADEYRCQIQGQLWLCEREWCDRLAYHPSLPKAVVRVYRDEEFIEKLAECVDEFVERMLAAREQLKALGCRPCEVIDGVEIPSGEPTAVDIEWFARAFA